MPAYLTNLLNIIGAILLSCEHLFTGSAPHPESTHVKVVMTYFCKYWSHGGTREILLPQNWDYSSATSPSFSFLLKLSLSELA